MFNITECDVCMDKYAKGRPRGAWGLAAKLAAAEFAAASFAFRPRLWRPRHGGVG